MADSALNAVLQHYITAVVAGENKQGNKKIHAFFYSKRYYHGCDTHPNLEEHAAMAKELAGYIRQLMQW
jgi:hypothetical protein